MSICVNGDLVEPIQALYLHSRAVYDVARRMQCQWVLVK